MNNSLTYISSLVEDIRSTGNHGTERWINQLPRNIGTLIVSIRQLEVPATQMVAPWCEEVMGEEELWDFCMTAFSPSAICIVELARSASQSVGIADGAVATLSRFLSTARDYTAPFPCYGTVWVSFLTGVMIVRQHIEALVASDDLYTDSAFQMMSPNVASDFYARVVNKLGRVPLNADHGQMVSELVIDLDCYLNVELQLARPKL